jgi:anaerobic ribonucleoside-triphosphate reductase activating protein
MNYLNITHCDQVNGEGNRVVLWVSGCSHHCKNCQNAYSWSSSEGIEFDQKAKDEIFKDLGADWCAGITYSGGDPMFFDNRETIIELAREIRERFPEKTQWLYTGYQWGEILNDPTMTDILKYVDVVCDGEYIEELRDIEKHWVGSSNQNVINVKKRIQQIANITE